MGGQTYNGGQPYGGARATPSARSAPPPAQARPPAQRRTDSPADALIKTVVRTAGNQITRQLVRGVLGSLFRR